MDADLDTLATALYARIDDTLKDRPELAPWRPKVGIAPKLSDAELLTLAVMQALLGFAHEARRLRHARQHLTHLFPYLPGQAGYNKRLRRSARQLQAMIRLLAEDTDVCDDTWLIDSTPVECSRSVPTTKRSRLAGNEVAQRMIEFDGAGVQRIMGQMYDMTDLDGVELLATKVFPQLK